MGVPDARTRYSRAFLHPLHVLALLGIMALAFVLRNPWIVYALAVLEALYLALVPNLQSFADYVERGERERRAEADKAEYDRLVGKLDGDNFEQHRKLKDLFRDIQDLICRPSGSVATAVADQEIRRVEQLLFSHLRMLLALQGLRRYREQANADEIRREIERAGKEASQEESPEVRKVKDSSTQILRERLKRVEKTGEQERLLVANVKVLEDTIRLIHDSVQTMGPGTELSEKIQEVAAEVSGNEQLLDDLKVFDKMEEDLSPSEARILRDRSRDRSR